MFERFVPREVLALHVADFPNRGGTKYGFSVHRGVVVQWDEDRDTRVLDFLDTLDSSTVQNLAIVQEHEGGIVFRWKYYVPQEFEEGGAVDVSGDSWAIDESTAFVQRIEE